MAEIFDAELIDVLQRLRSMSQMLLTLRETYGKCRFRDVDLDQHTETVVRFIELARKVPLNLSIQIAERFYPSIKSPPSPYERKGEWNFLEAAHMNILESGFRSVADTAILELKDKTLIAISSHHRGHYSDPLAEFGEAVIRAFAIEDDAEEAAKCLALGRSTACVFHLMRAAEAAAAILSKHLGGRVVKDDGEPLTFGGLFNEISGKIEVMPRGPQKDAWLKLKGFMSSLNRGTRTKVAHPGIFFSEKQAEAHFGQTKAFLEEAEELIRP